MYQLIIRFSGFSVISPLFSNSHFINLLIVVSYRLFIPLSFQRWCIRNEVVCMSASMLNSRILAIFTWPVTLLSLCLLQLRLAESFWLIILSFAFYSFTSGWCCHLSLVLTIISCYPDWFQSLFDGDFHFFQRYGILIAFLLTFGLRRFVLCRLVSNVSIFSRFCNRFFLLSKS